MEGISDKQTKIWVCSRCKAVFGTRWLLSRHIHQVHHMPIKESNDEAVLSEWWRVYNPNLGRMKAR